MSILEILLFVVAAIAAVRTLVTMMQRRALHLVEQVQKQVDVHREREKERKRRARRKALEKAA